MPGTGVTAASSLLCRSQERPAGEGQTQAAGPLCQPGSTETQLLPDGALQLEAVPPDQRPILWCLSGWQEPSPAVCPRLAHAGSQLEGGGWEAHLRGLLVSGNGQTVTWAFPAAGFVLTPKDRCRPTWDKAPGGGGRLKEKLAPGLPEPFQRDLGDRSSEGCRGSGRSRGHAFLSGH